jgi:type IV fimbrial biogenesis protein FimT
MRQLIRGMTLIELLIGFAITALLIGLGAPFMGDYVTNARLREAGNVLYAQALAIQAETMRRNVTMRLVVSGQLIELHVVDAAGLGVVDKQVPLPENVRAAAPVSMEFGSDGRPLPFGTEFTLDLQTAGKACSETIRCPGLRVDSGGHVWLCPNHEVGCP